MTEINGARQGFFINSKNPGNPVLLLGGICAAAGVVICLIAAGRAKKNKKYKGRH